MTKLEKLKIDLKESILNKDSVKKDVLRVVIGEIQTLENRGQEVSDERVDSIIKKMIEANQEVFAKSNEEKLLKENEFFESLLPETLSAQEIEDFLREQENLTVILSQEQDGQAIGRAIGLFKKQQLKVDNKIVSEAVKRLREDQT